jgi:hypothetical protein
MPAPDAAPVELSPETAAAVAAVHAWGQAFNDRDLDHLLALSAPDIELATPNRADRGHDAVRRLLHLQSYGVAQHAHPVRYIGRGSTVTVEASLELRWVDGGELADTSEGVAIFEVSDGRVHSFRPQPDLAAAFRVAGWPPPGDASTPPTLPRSATAASTPRDSLTHTFPAHAHRRRSTT